MNETLDQVIARLIRRGDARQYHWQRIKRYIDAGQYVQVMELVNGNQYDTDFCEQVVIVCDAIKAHAMNR